jgi:hypothetical protein
MRPDTLAHAAALTDSLRILFALFQAPADQRRRQGDNG